MTLKQRQFLMCVGGLIALSVTFTACGSGTRARPTALDPSNPEAAESPRMMLGRDGEATPTASKAHMGMAAPSNDPAESQVHGGSGNTSPPSGKGSK
jgi:hypothetical protein